MDRKVVNQGNLFFIVREGTTDEKVVPEVIKRREYFKRGFLQPEPNDVWLDLGANIGTFSVLVVACGGRVISFEPEPENFELLGENLKLNLLDGKAEIHRAAVVQGEESHAEFYLCGGEKNKYRHTLIPKRGRERIIVDCIQIDTLLGKVNAIKMDIEGEEIPILDSGKDWNGINKLVFEYHFDVDKNVANFRRRMNQLERAGFVVNYAKIPEDVMEYNFWPSGKVVRCIKRKRDNST